MTSSDRKSHYKTKRTSRDGGADALERPYAEAKKNWTICVYDLEIKTLGENFKRWEWIFPLPLLTTSLQERGGGPKR